MRGCGHVRVRVVPQRGRGLDDLPLGLPGLAHLNRRVRAAIRVGRQLHAMPVHRGHFNKVVGDLRADFFTAASPQSGPQEGAVEAPRPRAVVAGEDLRVAVLGGELEYACAVDNLSFLHGRDGQSARLAVVAQRLRLILRSRGGTGAQPHHGGTGDSEHGTLDEHTAGYCRASGDRHASQDRDQVNLRTRIGASRA